MPRKKETQIIKGIDHSKTYKKLTFRNLTHILRLRTQKRLLKKCKQKINSYADFGCSNGYITDLITKLVKSKKTYGYDHSSNIDIARKLYPEYKFEFIDLNQANKFEEKFDLITCFEVLEHVGNIEVAIDNLISSSQKNSKIIISVPIETGLIGLIKFLIKRIFFKYKFELRYTELSYLISLLLNKNISKYRFISDHYNSHFGFDHREIENYLRKKSIKYSSFFEITTKYFII